MKTIPHYINGSYIPTNNYLVGNYQDLDQSLKEYRVCFLSEHNPESSELLEAALQGLHETHSQILKGFFPMEERIDFLNRLSQKIKNEKASLAAILSFEIKKPISLAETEIDRSLITLEETLRCSHLFSESPTPYNSPKDLNKLSTLRIPLGPIACLVPFNFPINLALHKIAPAILSGAPIFLKPSPKALLTTACLVDILHSTGLPAGMLNFINCDFPLTQKIIKDPRIKLISFTGSEQIGWEIFKNTRKPITLELGGNAPAYVNDSCMIKKAAQELAVSAFSYGGQTCISTQNIYVNNKIYEEFKEQFLKEVEGLSLGPTQDSRSIYSSLIDSAAYARIEKLIQNEVLLGAQTYSFKKSDPSSNFITPTVIENASRQLLENEIFAPVVTLNSIESFQHWLEKINLQENRLQCSIYTSDNSQKTETAKINFGGIIINRPSSTRLDGLPYGGQGKSGVGREGPRYALEFMNTWKTILDFSDNF